MTDKKYKSHYDWLDDNLCDFFVKCGIDFEEEDVYPLLSCHGDKCYCYKSTWEKAGIHFYQGAAIYLLSHYHPFSEEVRNTKHGWVPVDKWVIDNKDRFLPLMNKVE